MRSRTATARLAAALAATAIATAGCTDAAGGSPTPPAAGVAEPGFGHIHGLGLNPADGHVYAATHHGVFQLDDGDAQRVADHYQDTMGFTITGPDRFLASGHPALDQEGPPHLGLIASDDAGQSWEPVALQGEVDFHALSVVGDTVYGWDSTAGTVMRSDDAGASWVEGAQLPALDLDVNPADPAQALATSPDGLLESRDGGLTFAPAEVQPPRPLVFVDHLPASAAAGPVLAGADAGGAIWTWDGTAWSEVGSLPSAPQAFTVAEPARWLAATDSGVFTSSDRGASWRRIAVTASG